MLKLSMFTVALACGLLACSSVPLPTTAVAADPSPAALPELRMSASTPTLPGGYKKVAAAAGATVYFVGLNNGDVVASPLLVRFGLRGIGVAPAGIEKENTGHHHLLIDVAELDVNKPLQMTDNIRHFGGGQTEARVELKPGTHTLQLLLADHNHIPHHPLVISERITVAVR